MPFESGTTKRITTVGTHVLYMRAGSQFLGHGPPVQHPNRGRWPSESPPPTPPSNPEAKTAGTRALAGLIEEGAARRAQDTSLSTWPAAGGYSPGSRQKRRRTRQSQQRNAALAVKAARPRGRRTHRTKHSARTGWGDAKEGKRFTPTLRHCLGLETGGAALRGRIKMGFRGANLNSSAKATGTETPRRGRTPGNKGDERCGEKGRHGRGQGQTDGPAGVPRMRVAGMPAARCRLPPLGLAPPACSARLRAPPRGHPETGREGSGTGVCPSQSAVVESRRHHHRSASSTGHHGGSHTLECTLKYPNLEVKGSYHENYFIFLEEMEQVQVTDYLIDIAQKIPD
ncbi:uncharacterized protein LOC115291284 [Suricata suricatta]|uniref:uncharacterized protein LOC115291284 n=1 Tax=Suricata suricatta TaxID=37032 RepID=UPI001155FCF9|nr:uncharacterized protein LOC115291284 [Suricata suricatta]